MPRVLDVKKIVEGNPNIDQDMLEKSMETLDQLRKMGVRSAKYDIVSPYERRRIFVDRSGDKDPRFVETVRHFQP